MNFYDTGQRRDGHAHGPQDGGDGAQERRDIQRNRDLTAGRVVNCTGSTVTIASPVAGDAAPGAGWTIGNLASINIGAARIVGFVRSVEAMGGVWSPDGVNEVVAVLDLLGEITEQPGAGLQFQRGIKVYPPLGAIAHRIRHADLCAVYAMEKAGAVSVGALTQDATIPATIDIGGMLERHFAVVGTTGVGKSTSVSLLMRKAVAERPRLRVIVLDPHNEFAAAFRGHAHVLDAKTFELPFWLFRLEEFAEVAFRGREKPQGEIDILREAVEQARDASLAAMRNGGGGPSLLKRSFRGSGDTAAADKPLPFRMTDIFQFIDEEMGRLESRFNRFDLKSLRYRLKEVAEDPSFGFMFGRCAVDDSIEEVFSRIFRIPDEGRRICVLQLAGIPSDAINVVVSVLARLSFDIAMLSEGAAEVLLLCEEAHRYIPADPRLGFFPTRAAVGRIAKEGRKYGAYLGIVTQRPSELDQTILSQCSTIFAMRLANERDQEIIRSAIPDSSAGILGFLSAIGNREAIAFGEAVATPMRMRFVDIAPEERPCTAQAEKRADGALNLASLIGKMRGVDAPRAAAQAGDPPRPAPQAAARRPAPSLPAAGDGYGGGAHGGPFGGTESWPTYSEKSR